MLFPPLHKYWGSYGNGNSLIVTQKCGFLDNSKPIQATLMKLDTMYVNRWQCVDYARHLHLLSRENVVAVVTKEVRLL